MKFKLKEYLDEKKISIHWLSEATGIRYATVFSMVNHNRERITLKHLGAVMKALNIKDVNLILELQK